MREDKQKKKVCDLNYSFLTVLHAYDIIFVLLHILVNEFDQLTSIFFSLRWLYNDWNSAQFLTIQAQGLKKDMVINTCWDNIRLQFQLLTNATESISLNST